MEGRSQSIRVSVRPEALDVAALIGEVSRPDAGAVVVFLGTVRDHSEGREGVTHLEYEVHPEMVEPVLERVARDAAGRWEVLDIVVAHRSGTVQLEEPSVAVVVSAAHRDAAFAAARHLIDELKEEAPIWKKEHWAGGSEWRLGS